MFVIHKLEPLQSLIILKTRLKPVWEMITAPTILVALITLLRFSSAWGQTPASSTVWLPVVMMIRATPNPLHQGIATYYKSTGAGACMFDPSPADLMVSAMNAEEYDNAAVCGEYVHVTGPKGAVTVRIVDLCPECGTKIEIVQVGICPNCGADVKGAKFCPECGTKVA